MGEPTEDFDTAGYELGSYFPKLGIGPQATKKEQTRLSKIFPRNTLFYQNRRFRHLILVKLNLFNQQRLVGNKKPLQRRSTAYIFQEIM